MALATLPSNPLPPPDPKTETLPRHVAIVMDGNGRWAERRGLPRIAGHQEGVKRVRTILECACRLNIPYLTLYAFSVQNWSRPSTEVGFLMGLFEHYLNSERDDLVKRNVRFRVMGRTAELAPQIQRFIQLTESATRKNTGTQLTLAVNYGGRSEIVDAVKSLLARGIGPEEVTEEEFARHMYVPDLPDPDLLIRTSGEVRVSNFLLWQIAYAELLILDTPWPDFGEEEFQRALAEYSKRKRRFGGL